MPIVRPIARISPSPKSDNGRGLVWSANQTSPPPGIGIVRNDRVNAVEITYPSRRRTSTFVKISRADSRRSLPLRMSSFSSLIGDRGRYPPPDATGIDPSPWFLSLEGLQMMGSRMRNDVFRVFFFMIGHLPSKCDMKSDLTARLRSLERVWSGRLGERRRRAV